MERETAVLKAEMKEFKNEMKDFKDEMKEFKDEMLEFKVEMKEFKNEMLEFKDEMKDFKSEMLEFKNEMKDFKSEMQDFKDEMRQVVARLDKSIATANKQMGELSNRLGTIVEDIVIPNIPMVFMQLTGNVHPLKVYARHWISNINNPSDRREFDAIAFNHTHFLVNETKSKPSVAYINEFIEKLNDIYFFYPEHRDKILIPLFSSTYLDESITNYLTRKKIFAMAMAEDTMKLINADKVQLPQ
ncbi:MAG: hypothetical protein HC892_02045 [Saprospiraceae bacterium]|nr:hypothetical protein [Saprospiraceae bacterium]